MEIYIVSKFDVVMEVKRSFTEAMQFVKEDASRSYSYSNYNMRLEETESGRFEVSCRLLDSESYGHFYTITVKEI